MYEKNNALEECEKNDTPGEGDKNNRSKESDETGKASLVLLQVLSILEKEIAGSLEDPKFIFKVAKEKVLVLTSRNEYGYAFLIQETRD